MNTKHNAAKLKGCLEWALNLMKLAGYWFPRNGNTKKITQYTIYSTFVVGCTLIALTCAETAYLVMTFGQLKEMIDGLFMLLTHAMQCLKVITFISKKEMIYSLLDCIGDKTFLPKNLHQWKIAMKITKYTNKLAKILVGLVVVGCLFCGLSTSEAITGTRQLPAKAWYPFDTETSPRFEIMSAYQTVCLLICGCANAAMDMVAAAFISQICVQLDLLSDTLVHVKDFAELELAKNSFLSSHFKDEDPVTLELEREMKTVLIECVKHHLKLKEFAANVEDVFSFPLFAQFLTAVGTICMTLFEMSLVPKRSIYYGVLLMYQSCMLAEIAIFCWYGNEVIYKSKKLSISLYNSEWTHCSNGYKKMILITMANMQQELNVCVGKLVVFSLETFVTVLRTAWSYFLVLDQLRQDY